MCHRFAVRSGRDRFCVYEYNVWDRFMDVQTDKNNQW